MALHLGSSEELKICLNGVEYCLKAFPSLEEEMVVATNVLKDMTFEVGGITTAGEDDDSITTNMRSSMVDISSLQATTSASIAYHFVVYNINGEPVKNCTIPRYDANSEYVSAIELNTSYNEQYGYPDNALAIFFDYNKYTPIKKCRFSINASDSPKIRVAIYKIVDGVAQLVDECDVNNPIF